MLNKSVAFDTISPIGDATRRRVERREEEEKIGEEIRGGEEKEGG